MAEMQVPDLGAKEPFFGGKLMVQVSAGRGYGMRGGPGGGGGRRGGGGPGMGGMGGGPGGGMGGGPGGGMGGGPGGGMGGPGGGGMMGGSSDGPSIHIPESNFPPVAIQVILTNKGTETVEVTFVRCKSALGDFAVRPEKLALAPEQTSSPDRMTSTLGLTTETLELTLALKMGGVVESKVLILKVEPSTAPAGGPGTQPAK